ncbi:hypothetical protein B296_00054621 [Ensete ventricosum]|uniref:Uncharacterized protein n=1 Tax=Ensete ventricosum TaxID=4639 RepID=A0A426WYK5_ENSVE|nr:hypothetical protein B296_00054621 [Ensete ventricosum]
MIPETPESKRNRSGPEFKEKRHESRSTSSREGCFVSPISPPRRRLSPGREGSALAVEEIAEISLLLAPRPHEGTAESPTPRSFTLVLYFGICAKFEREGKARAQLSGIDRMHASSGVSSRGPGMDNLSESCACVFHGRAEGSSHVPWALRAIDSMYRKQHPSKVCVVANGLKEVL